MKLFQWQIDISEDDPWYMPNPIDICPPAIRPTTTPEEWARGVAALEEEMRENDEEWDRGIASGEIILPPDEYAEWLAEQAAKQEGRAGA